MAAESGEGLPSIRLRVWASLGFTVAFRSCGAQPYSWSVSAGTAILPAPDGYNSTGENGNLEVHVYHPEELGRRPPLDHIAAEGPVQDGFFISSCTGWTWILHCYFQF